MNRRSLDIVDEAVFHCAASPHEEHDDISVIEQWHREPEKNFLPTPEGVYCGYHFYIKMDGTVQVGRPLHWYGQHCSGKNWRTIGICFGGMGGLKGIITDKQFEAAKMLLIELKEGRLKNLSKASQHSDYAKHKPHCAGLSTKQLQALNILVA